MNILARNTQIARLDVQRVIGRLDVAFDDQLVCIQIGFIAE